MASEKLNCSLDAHNLRAPFPDDFVCTPPPAADQRRPPPTINCTPKFSAAANFRSVQPHPPSLFRQQWSPKSRHGDSSDDEEDDDDVDDDDELDDVAEERSNFDENVVTVAKMNDVDSNKYGGKTKLLTALGINKEILTRATVIDNSNNENYSGNLDRLGNYYRRYDNCPSTSSTHKDAVGLESCCRFSGRKEGSSGDSVRSIFSDPISGMLMDDAMILPCGHSFGSGGMQHILRVKTCYSCSQPVSDDSIIPNLSLRIAVEAFKREVELHADSISKRRRERYEQDKGTTNDSTSVDFSSGRGVQFPFTVTDRVIIKGNKRTPPRFVGREAIVTTQCLNGWYVVKTLDNAESVKLQYRSLAKISDNGSSVKPSKIKATPPNWL